jgi:hypothetical protein
MAKKTKEGLKVVVCGPRDFNDADIVFEAIEKSEFVISEIVSGGSTGVDTIGEHWAREKGIPVKRFVPDWSNIDVPGAVVKANSKGKYNAKAGFDRNQKIAEYADALIVLDLDTNDTSDMVERAEKAGLKVFKYRPNASEEDSKYLFFL